MALARKKKSSNIENRQVAEGDEDEVLINLRRGNNKEQPTVNILLTKAAQLTLQWNSVIHIHM